MIATGVAVIVLAVALWACWEAHRSVVAYQKTDAILTRLEEDGLSARAKVSLAYHLWGLSLITTEERKARCLRIVEEEVVRDHG